MKERCDLKNEKFDPIHELWLIYCQLKDAEAASPDSREELVSLVRTQLGQLVNELNRFGFELKSVEEANPAGRSA